MLSYLISASNGCLEHVSRSSTAPSNSSQFQPTGAMSVPTDKPTRTEYASHLFLNREAEVTRFSGLLDKVIRGVAGIRRVLVFEGERGVGKSWLLKHMHWLAVQQTGVASFLVRFDPQYDVTLRVTANKPAAEVTIACKLNSFTARPEQLDDHSKHQLKELLTNIAAYLHKEGLITEKLPTVLTLDETSFTLARLLRSGLQNRNRVFVLLIDSAYEADWPFIAGLEDYVLAPLVAIDQVAVVLSGRGRPFPWINSLLRIEPEQDSLQLWREPDPQKANAAGERQRLFDLLCQLIRKQIGKHPFWDPDGVGVGTFPDRSVQQERLEQIWNLAQGQPLLTVRLAYNTDAGGDKAVQPTLDQGTLDEFAEEEIFTLVATDEREKVRRYLEALCVLDFFRETEAERVIGKYFELQCYDEIIASGREILARLQRIYLVRWDRHEAQFFVDNTVRITLSNWMFLARNDDWRKLHEEAQRMYESWAKEYPKHQEYYQKRAQVHARTLERSSHNNGTPTCQVETLA